MYRSGGRALIVFAVTVPETMSFLSRQIQYLIDSGFEVAVICSPGWHNETAATYYPVKMEREISLCKDLRSLIRITMLLLSLKPDIINAGTPKASFLVGMAAFLTRVPIRVYMCHGLRIETAKGWKRRILSITERITAACATTVCCVSHSVKSRLLELGLANPNKLDMIGFGSVNGINLEKFHPEHSRANAKRLLNKHSIPSDAFVIGFVGRLTTDKGIPEAIVAFRELKQYFTKIVLVLVGNFEDGDPLPKQTVEWIANDPQIILTGFSQQVAEYYHIFNLLWLPSHREGLPTVLLEAAACGLPVIACKTTGCVDVVDHGKTGYLVTVGDSKSLAAYTKKLLRNTSFSIAMGQRGRKRVEQHFQQTKVWENTKQYYQKLLILNQENSKAQQSKPYRIIKRAFDLFGALFLLMICSPLMAFVAIVVRMHLGSPVIFKQLRPGLYGKPISIYKFRTMTEEFDTAGNVLPDHLRLTAIGKFLRRASLDELPQLFNVVKGDISVIGPRPLLMEYLPLYSPEQARRHEVKPGITGWAQVNGRNEISWEEKFRLDVWYVENQCLWLDMKILWMTLRKVCKREGINQQGHVTMPRFRGSGQWQDY